MIDLLEANLPFVAVALVFLSVMVGVAGWYEFGRRRHFAQRASKLSALNGVLKKLARPTPWAIVDESIAKLGWVYGEFQEFYEQCWLVEGELFNSEQAGEFLDQSHIEPPQNAGLDVVPSLLTGIGILGTFLGIVYGLFDLGDAIENGDSNNVALKAATSRLVVGLLFSFSTSIVGLVLSMAFTYLQRKAEDALESERVQLVAWLNSRVKRSVTPQLLSHILDSQREGSSESRKEQQLLIEELKQVSSAMRSGFDDLCGEARNQTAELKHLTQTLHESVENAVQAGIQGSGLIGTVQTMADTMASQQSDGMKDLVTEFTDHLGEAFGQNFQNLGVALDGMVEASGSFQDRMGGLVQELGVGIEGQREAAIGVQQAAGSIQDVVQSLSLSASEMQGAAGALGAAMADQRQALQAQREAMQRQLDVNAGVVTAVEQQTEGWRAHQDAVQGAYTGIQDRFDALGASVEALTAWHDRVKQSLKDQVDAWQRAIEEQVGLTESVADERSSWRNLVDALQGSTSALDGVAGTLSRTGSSLETQLQGAEQARSEGEARLAESIGTLQRLNEAQQSSAEAQNALVERVLGTVGAQTEAWGAHREAVQGAYDGIQDRFEGLAGAVEALQGWHQQVQGALQSQVDAWHEAVQEQSRVTGTLADERTGWKTMVEALDQSTERLGDSASLLSRSSAQLEAQLEGAERSREQGERRLTETLTSLHDLNEAQTVAARAQREMSDSLLGTVQAHTEGWQAQQGALVGAYATMDERLGQVGVAVDSLVRWHEEVKDALGGQVASWRDAVDVQLSLTTSVREERAAWRELLGELGDATRGLGSLGTGLQELAGRVSTEVGTLQATQSAGHAELASVGTQLQELSGSLGDSWKDYAEVARALSTSLPDVATLLQGLTQAVDAQRTLVGDAREVASAFKETGATQRELSSGLSDLVKASSQAAAVLEPASTALGQSASALEEVSARLASADSRAEQVSTALVSAAQELERRDAANRASWQQVTQELGAGSNTFRVALKEYQEHVDKAVSNTFKDFDRETAAIVGELAGSVNAMHELVEHIEGVVQQSDVA